MTQILSVKRARIKGFVYFMETIGAPFIKIGWAIDPLERLKDLQIGCPHELKLITVIPNKSRRVEHRLQNKFKSLCVRSEWFKYTDRLKSYVQWIISKTGDPEILVRGSNLLRSSKQIRSQRPFTIKEQDATRSLIKTIMDIYGFTKEDLKS